MKTNGLQLTKEEFYSLSVGDVYFYNEVREHSKYNTNSNYIMHSISSRGASCGINQNPRWLTNAEYASYKLEKAKASIPSFQKITGESITEEDCSKYVRAKSIIYISNIIKEVKDVIKGFDLIIITTDGHYNQHLSCRWPTQEQYFEYKTKLSNDRKTSGHALTVEEFNNLQPGDLLVSYNGKIIFENFSQNGEKKIVAKNSFILHAFANVRWPTKEEAAIHMAKQEVILHSKQKSNGSILLSIELQYMKPGILLFVGREVREVRGVSDSLNYIQFKDYVATLNDCRWPTEKELEDYNKLKDLKKSKEESKSTMKRNGMFLSQKSFDNLKPDDIYLCRIGEGDHISKFHDYICGPSGKVEAMSTNGINSLRSNMRWPTENEYNLYKNSGITCFYNKYSNNHETDDNDKKEDTKMTNNQTTALNKSITVVKDDAVDAAWRAAAKQAVKSAKVPLLAFLGAQKLPGSVLGFIASQADTENGEAVLAILLGVGITYVPNFGNDPKFVRLAKELRVLGMETFFTKVANVMLNPLRDQIVEIVKALPFAAPE